MSERTGLEKTSWTGKVSHHGQWGGIETSVIDNGAGRGTRIAWINTGSGLRFKVVIDRALDIADAFFNRHSLAWISHAGITSPQPFSDRGVDWLRTFGGGLLTTCGLSHVGGPESDAYGSRGLHGLISNIPATLESIVQPDLATGKLGMSITGKMIETKVFGPTLALKRTISATLGQSTIHIHDQITNLANTPAPVMLLYHFNFGWPLVDEGSDILWDGSWRSRRGVGDKIFNTETHFRKCPTPQDSHQGAEEEVALIDPKADATGTCTCGIHNVRLGLAVAVRFQKKQLPWLTNWQHWGPGEYVTGLEPGTNPPIGQAKAREAQSLLMLAPGESVNYEVALDVMTEENEIQTLLRKTRPNA